MEWSAGNRFLGLVWDGQNPASVEHVKSRVDPTIAGWFRIDQRGLLFASERSGFHAVEGDTALCMASKLVVEAEERRSHDPASLLARIRSVGLTGLSMLAPPFAIAWITAQAGTLEAVADPFGIGQLFYAASGSIAAVSNSAALLARAFDRDLDLEALTGFALFGAFQESDTPFVGVTKVLAGNALRLSAGRCELQDVVPGRFQAVGFPDVAVADLAILIREIMAQLSDTMPEADLELSGGLDSRLMLAALPRDRRKRHRTLTIGRSDSPDVQIASEIAEQLGLRHQIVDIQAFDDIGSEDLYATLVAAVRGYDFAANPIDKVTLLLANKQFSGTARFNGQNGEILRGYYFPSQPLGKRPNESMARRLIRWRLESNDMVDPMLFQRESYLRRRARAETRTVQRLTSLGDPWSVALDRFYLYERMQRWVGNSAGNFLSDRIILCPFFDPRFVAASLGMSAQRKANSRAAFELLSALDPDLAAIPLDSGLQPLMVVKAPVRARLAETGHFLEKVGARIQRKLVRGDRPTLGSASIGQLWHLHRLFDRLPGDRLKATGLFDEVALERILLGQWLPDRPTLGFVLMIAQLVEDS